MAQKSDRKIRESGWGGWGGGGAEEEREILLSFGIRIHGGGDPTLQKGRRLPVPNIPGDEKENRSTRGENPLLGCSGNSMILILMRVSLQPKLRKNNN